MCSETSAYKIQAPKDYPEGSIQYSFYQNIILISIKNEKFHKKIRAIKDLLLNRLHSNVLELSADFVIKLYIGIRDTSLCL
jgi:hypothetical protein